MTDPSKWDKIRSLGEGGQAHTFLVRDPSSVKPRVLKRLKNIERVARFEREIKVIASLDHPGILKLHSYDVNVAKPYFISDFYERGSLQSYPGLFKNKPVEALEFLTLLSDALATAHSRGIVHRDVKPANVLLTDDWQPVLADFGICFVCEGERVTLTDEAVGARLFVPPELEDGRSDDVTPRSDVYSLGKLLYWMLAGGRLFAREQHRRDEWNLLRLFDRNHYELINRMLDNMVQPDPRDRYANATVVRDAARHVADLVRREARAIGPGLRQTCSFCKQGFYDAVPMGSPIAVRNFGLEAVGGAKWRAMVCGTCGHVELFRIENIAAPNWWRDS